MVGLYCIFFNSFNICFFIFRIKTVNINNNNINKPTKNANEPSIIINSNNVNKPPTINNNNKQGMILTDPLPINLKPSPRLIPNTNTINNTNTNKPKYVGYANNHIDNNKK